MCATVHLRASLSGLRKTSVLTIARKRWPMPLWGSMKQSTKRSLRMPDFWKIGIAEAIRKLINLEISAKPSFVGPPISILTIDKSGPRWIEQGACPDVGTR